MNLSGKGTASRSGRIAQGTRATGNETRPRAVVNIGTHRATSTRANSETTKPMATACTLTSTVLATRGTGSTTCRKGRDRRPGTTDPNTLVLSNKDANTAMAYTSGLMGPNIRAIGWTTRSRVLAPTYGLTNVSTLDTGRTERCTAKASSRGLMGDSTLVRTKRTKNTDTGHFYGKMEVNTRGIGSMGDNMERARLRAPKVLKERAFGTKGSWWNGSIKWREIP